MLESRTPEQKRLDDNVPAPGVFQQVPSPEAMGDQWKTSSQYITTADVGAPSTAPFEYTPGSTAGGTRRLHAVETTLPYGQNTTQKAVWPPTLNPIHNFKLASYPPQSYAGAHLERRTLVAGLGGIDPTM